MRYMLRHKINVTMVFLSIIIMLSITTFPILGFETISQNNNLREGPSIMVGPYPQNPQKNSISILWQTDIKTSRNEVHWGETPDCENIVPEHLYKNIEL